MKWGHDSFSVCSVEVLSLFWVGVSLCVSVQCMQWSAQLGSTFCCMSFFHDHNDEKRRKKKKKEKRKAIGDDATLIPVETLEHLCSFKLVFCLLFIFFSTEFELSAYTLSYSSVPMFGI
jgi:hypothetical protein